MKRFVYSLAALAILAAMAYSGAGAADTAASAAPMQPLSEALHVLPPIGETSGTAEDFDESLLPYLNVAIWQVIGENEYTRLGALTPEKTDKGLDYIKLQGSRYHVNWDITKESIGKTFLLFFTLHTPALDLQDLNIGYVTYGPLTGRTLPIIFRIDDHPSLRARAVHAEGFSAAQTALALMEEFQSGAGELVQILTDEAYDIQAIGAVLHDILGSSPAEAAQLLANTEAYTAMQIAEVLVAVYGMGGSAQETAQILKDAGFSASEIMGVLKNVFGLETAAIVQILEAIGFSADELFAAASRELAEKFAPQLRFDQAASTFPMSAQVYFDNAIGKDVRLQNKDASTLTTPGQEPPTYFKAFQVGNQVRIVYWWYYGYQPGCWAFGTEGVHDGDWEHAMVILSEDMTKVVAITLFQHTGYYTRLAQGADTERWGWAGVSYDPGFGFYGEHPIIYVGKTQHGSYHNQGGEGDSFTGLSYCPYFADWRNNEGIQSLWLDTQKNLVSMADLEERWMVEETAAVDLWTGSGDGTTTTFDLDSAYVKAGSVVVKINAAAVNSDAWTFSDGTGTGGVDQVIFNAAPESGAAITADYERGDFRWGCGKCEENGISTHPIKATTASMVSTLDACSGKSSTYFADAGCFESQCEYHDNQSWFDYLISPGTCSHCPSGYINMGSYCWKDGWPWEWDFTSIHYYGLDYPLSQTDKGLSKSR